MPGVQSTPDRITSEAFADRVVGKPWRLRGCSFDGMDCWGLLVLFFRHVHGIALAEPERTDDHHADFPRGLQALAWEWIECGPLPGACAFVAFDDGAPRHCGVLLEGGLMLHAEGDIDRPGFVRATRMPAWVRRFPDTRFFRHVSTC